MMIRRVVAQGFAPAMIIALGLLIAGVFVLMRLESKWGLDSDRPRRFHRI
jgi:flagellar biogenesis protein FliO